MTMTMIDRFLNETQPLAERKREIERKKQIQIKRQTKNDVVMY